MKNNTLQEKLVKYSALGSAFLLSAPLAQANIQYTDVDPDQTFTANQGINIDLNGDNIDDVRIQVNGFVSVVSATPLNGAFLAGYDEGWAYPYALPYCANISNGLAFGIDGNASNNTVLNSVSIWGNWTGGNVDAYLGVRFDIGGNTHFGYVHLEVVSSGEFILKDYAYEDEADTAIAAGKQAAPSPAIPSMSQWGIFLFGLVMITISMVIIYNLKKGEEQEHLIS